MYAAAVAIGRPYLDVRNFFFAPLVPDAGLGSVLLSRAGFPCDPAKKKFQQIIIITSNFNFFSEILVKPVIYPPDWLAFRLWYPVY